MTADSCRSETIAEAVEVTKRYGAFVAVDRVSLTVAPAEIVGLLGANGAGKTTLIEMLLGLTAPTSGTVSMFGHTPSRATRTGLGYVPQGLGLWPAMTVAENIAFVARAFHTDQHPPLPPALAAVREEPVAAIGSGLQRQLAFAIALLHRPQLLVLDEPTSGVDALARARLWDVIHEQADAGTGILVTTHNMQEAQQCDRLVLLSHGRQVAAGSETAIIGDTTANEVDCDDWAAAFAALTAAGLPVTLAGRRIRLADVDADTAEAVLAGSGLTARIHRVPATLEEKMIILDRSR
jgi:ABC-2 type transport system ATP-binding protein/ribosome-dependent ATPase